MLKRGSFIFAFLILIAWIVRFFQFGQAWYRAETHELHACHAVGSASGSDVSEINRYIQDGTIPPTDVYWILSQRDDLHCTQASTTQMTPSEQVKDYIEKNLNTLEEKIAVLSQWKTSEHMKISDIFIQLIFYISLCGIALFGIFAGVSAYQEIPLPSYDRSEKHIRFRASCYEVGSLSVGIVVGLSIILILGKLLCISYLYLKVSRILELGSILYWTVSIVLFIPLLLWMMLRAVHPSYIRYPAAEEIKEEEE
ncbi:hypothetical protein MKA38_09065 [[Clostridium] innocuum]|nr:hypothetical protein [[Clostridium] innocuum]